MVDESPEVFADDCSAESQLLEGTTPLAKIENGNEADVKPPVVVSSSDPAMQGLLLESGIPKEAILDEDDGLELTEDIYSLLYTSELFSTAFFYALFCNVFQYVFIVLVIVDVLSKDSNNRFNIPSGVPLQVTIGQGCALLLALSMQDDLLTGIMYVHRGHKCRIVGDTLPGATTIKWYFAAIAQLAAGAGLNMVIFVLVMQSKDIIGMFLNFAALMFISEIDDIGFKLADNGFVNKALKAACDDVRRVKVCVTQDVNTTYQRGLFVLMLGFLYIGYGTLTYRQLHGQFLCNRIRIQFGDDFGTEYAAFSGVYIQTNRLIEQRVTYIEEKRIDNPAFAGRIGYCKSEAAWTLYLDGSNGPCDWLARSPESESFDVTTTIFSNWLTTSAETREILAYSSFYLSCFDCNDKLCSQENGRCEDSICVCKPGRYGASCEFGPPCESLTVDRRTSSFPILADGQVVPPDSYELLRVDDEVVMIYDKPVYTTETRFFGGRYALVFTGRRYAMLFYIDEKDNNSRNGTLLTLLLDSPGGYHSYFESPAARRDNVDESLFEYEFAFLSESMDEGTSSHKLSPEGLHWFSSRGSFEGTFDDFPNSGPVFPKGFIDAETSLLCAVCDDDTNPCFGINYCDEVTKRCDCDVLFYPYEGALCESIQDCNANPSLCENGGTCDESSGNCRCPAYATGKFCGWQQDCSASGCMDGGTCDTLTGYCNCPNGKREGDYEYCATPGNCAISGCQNGGECTDSGICSCPPEFWGPFCEEEWNCNLILCEIGGGTCNPEGFCECPAYTRGRFCEKGADCILVGCMDGGSCNIFSGQCVCPTDVPRTLHCETSGNCADFGCSGVGNCTATGVCECPEIYDGAFCQW